MTNFQIGDVVKLTSSTLPMTIASAVDGDGLVYCIWMGDDKLPIRKEFIADTLELVRRKRNA